MMETGCSCDIDYDDVAVIWTETHPVAHKQHKCCECRGVIQPGERYVVVRSLYDGAWSTSKVCWTCNAIRQDLAPCAPLGELRSELWECLGFDYVTGDEDDRWESGEKGR